MDDEVHKKSSEYFFSNAIMVTKRIVQMLTFQIVLAGCTLVPSAEYVESDELKSSITTGDLSGTYGITNDALNKLRRHYTAHQIDSMKHSTIVINADDTSIQIKNVPLNKSASGEYVISSGEGKLVVSGWGHEKFRHINRPDSQYPKMEFRQKDTEKMILVNLEFDPDVFDYYTYVLQN